MRLKLRPRPPVPPSPSAVTLKFSLIRPGKFYKIFTRSRGPTIEPDMPRGVPHHETLCPRTNAAFPMATYRFASTSEVCPKKRWFAEWRGGEVTNGKAPKRRAGSNFQGHPAE